MLIRCEAPTSPNDRDWRYDETSPTQVPRGCGEVGDAGTGDGSGHGSGGRRTGGSDSKSITMIFRYSRGPVALFNPAGHDMKASIAYALILGSRS